MVALDFLKMSQNSVKDNNMGYMKKEMRRGNDNYIFYSVYIILYILRKILKKHAIICKKNSKTRRK